MTVIRPNSISGVTSITGSGGDITIFRADGTAADVTVNNITSGIITATHYGNGANLTNLPAGQLTGTVADARLTTVSSSKLSGALPALDGSSLTGINTAFGNSSVNTTGIITATAFVPSQGQLSHRNLIINGAMNVAQRGTSSTSVGYVTIDRFNTDYGGENEAMTYTQADVSSGTTPYTEGFRKTFKVQNGNQTGGAGSGDYVFVRTKIEAQDLANSGWNYVSSSSFITLSFWVKSSVAQTFYGRLESVDGTAYNYPYSYSVSANTWTKVVKTIPGNSNLQIDNNNGSGMEFHWDIFRGSNFSDTGVALDTWATYASGTRTPSQTSTWWTTNDATWELTGVQLEVGSVATPFEHRSYGEEFERCQRYYQQYVNISAVGYVPDNSSRSYSHAVPLPVAMRSGPTMSITNTGSSNGQMISDGDTNRYISSLLSQGSQTTHMSASFNLTGDLANFRGAYLIGTTNTTSQTTYKLSAEL